MFRRRFFSMSDSGLLTSQLFDQRSFYPAFIADTKRATTSIVIESPFISHRRLQHLRPALEHAARRGVTITINTRDPYEQGSPLKAQAEAGIELLQDIGVRVLFTGRHHRKLAVLDCRILWEGSLNILSQNDSCEVMRRIDSSDLAKQMIRFTGLQRWYTTCK